MQKVQNVPFWATKSLKGGHFFLIKDDFFEDLYFDQNMLKFLGLFLQKHTVQQLMLSKGAKKWIWDDITWSAQYFWQMTITRSEDINKDDTSISNLFKQLLDSANTSVQF